jgi:hypothetical protein
MPTLVCCLPVDGRNTCRGPILFRHCATLWVCIWLKKFIQKDKAKGLFVNFLSIKFYDSPLQPGATMLRTPTVME